MNPSIHPVSSASRPCPSPLMLPSASSLECPPTQSFALDASRPASRNSVDGFSSSGDVKSIDYSGSKSMDDNTVENLKKDYPKILSVNLSHCPNITDKGIEALSKKFPDQLSLITINETKVTKAALDALAKQHPKVVIESLNSWDETLSAIGPIQIKWNPDTFIPQKEAPYSYFGI